MELDESVDKTVRAMNWRPAERNGKSLPMRFLVRYNFKKIDKESIEGVTCKPFAAADRVSK